MNKSKICLTPDAIYETKINSNLVSVSIQFPFELNLTKKQAKEIEWKLHLVIEGVLAKLYHNKPKLPKMKLEAIKVGQKIRHKKPHQRIIIETNDEKQEALVVNNIGEKGEWMPYNDIMMLYNKV